MNTIFKRFIDVIIGTTILLVFMPIMIVVAFCVFFKLGKPVLFTQLRPGKTGKLFHIYKFRTMLNGIDKNGNVLPDEQRLTRFGRMLRATSLDELPGLINVIIGDMSLVGPRPLLPEYLPLYSERQARRHSVRPGITGWAQVNGRNAISWEEKFELDVWYVENQSFLLDSKILLLTLKKVFLKEGISSKGHVTIEPFKGSEK